MNLTKLRVLMLIGKYQKVTEVARIMGLRQPTITFHMKSLEQEYRIPLFQYRSGNVLLTEAGKALNHYAMRISTLVDEAERINQEFVSLNRGTLLIGASYVPAAYILPKVLKDFKSQYPALHVSLTVKSAPFVLEMLAQQQLDLGIISAVPEMPDGFVQQELCRDELVLVFPAESPLRGMAEIGFSDLQRAELIIHSQESTTRKLIEEWLAKQRISLRRTIEVDSLEVIKKLLLSGWGYSILARRAVEEEVRAGRLHWSPLPGGPIVRGIYLIYHEERWVSPAMMQFLQAWHGKIF